jgi:hypothetical protein
MTPGSSSTSSSIAQASWSAGAVGWPSGAGLHPQHQRQQQQQQQVSAGVSAERFKPQELANLAWALAVMQQQCMLHSAPPLRHSCTRVDAAWKQQLCAAAAAQLAEFNAADLSMVLWALTVLGGGHVLQQQQQQQQQGSWLDGQLGRAVQLAGSMQGRHIAMLLWSVSQLQRQQLHTQQQQAQRTSRDKPGACTPASCPSADSSSSSSALQAFAGACFPRLQRLLPNERQQLRLCCVVLLACGHLQLQPPPAALQDLLAAAAGQLQQQSAVSWSTMRQWLTVGSSIESSSVTRPAAGTGRAQQWLSNSQQQQQQHQGVSLHDVTMLMYALAKLQYHPNRQFLAAADQAAATACWQLLLRIKHRKLQQQQQQGQLHQEYDLPSSAPAAAAAAARPGPPSHVRVKDISLLLWAMGKLRHTPSPKLLRLLCKAAAARLRAASASDVGLMLWGLARLRARPRHAWLQVLLSHFLARLDDSVHAAPAICNVVHALPHLPGGANLNRMLVARLSEGQQLQQLAGAARVRFEECGARELVALLQGFAALGFSPGAGWLAEHQQRCEVLGWGSFSEREQQLLSQAREVLVQQQQQQQPGGMQGAPGLALPAGAAHHPQQQQMKVAVLAALV